MTRNGCSTLARTLDFVVLFARATSSTTPLRRAPICHVPCGGRAGPDDRTMTLIGRITPYLGLLAMEPVGADRQAAS